MSAQGIRDWHDFLVNGDQSILDRIVADDCVFESPVVHTPVTGKAKIIGYMIAAHATLGGKDFEFVREFDCESRAVLEFKRDLNGIIINGVDLIEWNDAGQITQFKVMVRPLKAMQAMNEGMSQAMGL